MGNLDELELTVDEEMFGPDLPDDDFALVAAILAILKKYHDITEGDDDGDGPDAEDAVDEESESGYAKASSPVLKVCTCGAGESVGLAHKPGESLDRSPKANWVERAGGLPKYINDIAHDLHTERGMTISRAIATAVSKVKKWAAGGDNVKPDTRAKAAAALAEWEKLKAKGAAKRAAH